MAKLALTLTILTTWFWQDGLPVILLHNVPAANKPYVFATRLGLTALFLLLCYLVHIAWKRRPAGRGRPHAA